MVVLDEINIALRYDYLDIADVVAFLKEEKPAMTHVVLTGRNAKDELIEIADLVTEMACRASSRLNVWDAFITIS